jgi:predicted nucleic acid-binding protein
MKALIDTNVLLDVLTQREPYYESGAKIWTLVKEGIIQGHISAIYVNNLYYIIKKLTRPAMAEAFVDELLADFEVVSLTKDILGQARSRKGRDYEDLIQYFSAIHSGCEYIVTRNKKDFPCIGIKLATPDEILKAIRKL